MSKVQHKFIFSFLTQEFERFKKAICPLRRSYVAQAGLGLVTESPAQVWSAEVQVCIITPR